MAMVVVVMALAFSTICIVEYQRSLSVVQTALNDSVEKAIDDSTGFWHFEGTQGEFEMRQSEGQGASATFERFDKAQGGNGQKTVIDGSASSTSANENGQEANESTGDSQSSNESNSTSAEAESSESTGGAQGSAEADPYAGIVAPPEIGNRKNEPRGSNSLIPVAVYQVSSDGSTALVPQVTNASISNDLLSDAVTSVQSSSEGFGTITEVGLHYYKSTQNDVVYLAFADTSYTDNWQSLALMLVIIGLATIFIFFVISVFYSNWALKPVREAWDSQRQFVADASHDLKTPLTVVLANAAILLKHPERSIASESQWIESTQKEAETMQGLVNEMLELAQIEAGETIAVEKERLDFSDLVDGETLMFDAVALERNCQFECEITEGIGIYGNVKQVEKMVSTLVENAFKYVDNGGAVRIMLQTHGKNAVLSINNTGSIISPDDLPHIFDRFYRTDKARTSGEGGFGLGLAIAREIARQHDGDITCASDGKEGTTFTVTIPVQS